MVKLESMTPNAMRIIKPKRCGEFPLEIGSVIDADGSRWTSCTFRYQCKCGSVRKVVNAPVRRGSF